MRAGLLSRWKATEDNETTMARTNLLRNLEPDSSESMNVFDVVTLIGLHCQQCYGIACRRNIIL